MQITGHTLFIFMLWFGFIYILWMPLTWLILRFITPKYLVEKYFKEPHFKGGELIMMAQFPGSLFRTMILAGSCAFPSKGRVRQLTHLREDCPKWYVIFSALFVILSLGQGLLFLFMICILGVFLLFFPENTDLASHIILEPYI